MRQALLTGWIVALCVSSVPAAEESVESRIESVGLFKNGLAVVTRLVALPESGTCRIEGLPEPVHGTFWLESDVPVAARITTREVEVPSDPAAAVNLQEDLAGREVRIHFRDSQIPPAEGTVMSALPKMGEDAWDREYERSGRPYWRSSSPSGASQTGRRFLILSTDKGRVYVEPSMIAYLRVEGEKSTITRRLPVLFLEAAKKREASTTVRVHYLTKGMAWAPSYRVDISDSEKLVIEQKAVIKNELESLEGVRVYLISGFPSMEFSHVTSPLSLRTTWASFFQELAQRPGSGGGARGQVVLQQIAMNYVPPTATPDFSATPMGEGPDVHYQPAGELTLAEGDALVLPVASGTTDYERIVEWIVPDTRTENGRRINDYQRNQDPEKYRDAAWDAVRFKNPLEFPMTTAPAMTVAGGRFQGQRMCTWTNVGEEATLHITKALSIRTRCVEYEEQGEREIVYLGGNDYRKVMAKGELSVCNHRKETVKLVIRRRFSGDLLEAEGDPECSLLEEGVYSVNKRNELLWTIRLEPGAEKSLTYKYSVLVDN